MATSKETMEQSRSKVEVGNGLQIILRVSVLAGYSLTPARDCLCPRDTHHFLAPSVHDVGGVDSEQHLC